MPPLLIAAIPLITAVGSVVYQELTKDKGKVATNNPSFGNTSQYDPNAKFLGGSAGTSASRAATEQGISDATAREYDAAGQMHDIRDDVASTQAQHGQEGLLGALRDYTNQDSGIRANSINRAYFDRKLGAIRDQQMSAATGARGASGLASAQYNAALGSAGAAGNALNETQLADMRMRDEQQRYGLNAQGSLLGSMRGSAIQSAATQNQANLAYQKSAAQRQLDWTNVAGGTLEAERQAALANQRILSGSSDAATGLNAAGARANAAQDAARVQSEIDAVGKGITAAGSTFGSGAAKPAAGIAPPSTAAPASPTYSPYTPGYTGDDKRGMF